MLPLGTALFLAPQAAAPLWLWALTPLTARAVGSWLMGLGVAAGQASWEDDFGRVRVGFITYTALGGLELVALARYPSALDWSTPGAWVFLLFLISVLGVGLYGWVNASRIERRAAAGEQTARLA